MCATQLDALLADGTVTKEKRTGREGAGPRWRISNPIGCTAQPWAMSSKLIGPCGKERGKAARASRSSSPLCRPFPWAFSWLSVIRLEAVVTTDWRHDNDPNPSPELGPHHGLPLLLSTSPILPSHPTSLPPSRLLSAVLVPSPLPGTLEREGRHRSSIWG